tara:strand:+ start:843 stop:1109 length:267 start_codon:yes stop_codon:yes gene_type:complete
MKFELKTENENYTKSFERFFKTIFVFALIIIFCDVAIKLGIITRHYQIDNYCRLLSVEKSKSYFDKLSSTTKLKSKERIWEFCKKLVQ